MSDNKNLIGLAGHTGGRRLIPASLMCEIPMNPSLNTADRSGVTDVSPESLFPYLRQFGAHSLAYSTMQPNLEYFLCDNIGYVAFRKWRGFTFVLGNPVCDARRRSLLLEKFLQAYPDPAFLHITTATASELSSLGFTCNVMGVESWVSLPDFDPTWRSHSALAESRRRFRKLGVEILELPFSELADEKYQAGGTQTDLRPLVGLAAGEGEEFSVAAASVCR